MNETVEPTIFSRFKWLILGGSGLVLLFICGSLLLVLPEVMSNPQYKRSSEALFVSNPTSPGDVTDTPISTPKVSVTETIQPSEMAEGLPNREVAYVIQVIDGDTIEVFLNEDSYRLRYIGIDSPEIGTPNSEEATDANRRLVEGQIVELERDVTDVDQYGRLLRYVYLTNGTLVNAELVKVGFAKAVAYPPDVKYQEILSEVERGAQEAGIGLWAPPIATMTPISTVLIDQVVIDPACSQFNAPGNDNDNKNEEFVCLVNQGIELVDLTGWTVRDEYGWTYTIPGFALQPGATVRVRSGCGDNSAQDLFWCKDETAVWNNDGDCVYLVSEEGEMIAQYCY